MFGSNWTPRVVRHWGGFAGVAARNRQLSKPEELELSPRNKDENPGRFSLPGGLTPVGSLES